jgi:hypothetical protein
MNGATLWTMRSPEALVLPAAAILALALTAWKARVRARRTSSMEPEDLQSSMSR